MPDLTDLVVAFVLDEESRQREAPWEVQCRAEGISASVAESSHPGEACDTTTEDAGEGQPGASGDGGSDRDSDEGGGDDDDPWPSVPLRGGSSSTPDNPLLTYVVILVFSSQAFFVANAALNLGHIGQGAMVALCSLLMGQLALIAGLCRVPLTMPRWLRRLRDWWKGGRRSDQ